jgi:hypothetical protein
MYVWFFLSLALSSKPELEHHFLTIANARRALLEKLYHNRGGLATFRKYHRNILMIFVFVQQHSRSFCVGIAWKSVNLFLNVRVVTTVSKVIAVMHFS